ncbi:uncharacterized protein LOC144434411 [Glandiceps talaboti]
MTTSLFLRGPLKGIFNEEEIFTDEYKEITSHDYSFENLVLEGGGTKGIAYAGVLKVLEKVGIWQTLKRYGGASAGAIVACLLAVGYNPEQISSIIYKLNMEKMAVVVFEAVKASSGNHQDLFVDGGVLDNYPVRCYDGWWLSMEKEDNLFLKSEDLSLKSIIERNNDRFEKRNPKTLGVVLCSPFGDGLFHEYLVASDGKSPVRPDTKLARKCPKDPNTTEAKPRIEAFCAFMKVLNTCAMDQSFAIARRDLQEALKDANVNGSLSNEQGTILFGVNWNPSSAVKKLPFDKDDKITFDKVVTYAEKRNIPVEKRLMGLANKEISDIKQFFQQLVSTLTTDCQKDFFKVS